MIRPVLLLLSLFIFIQSSKAQNIDSLSSIGGLGPSSWEHMATAAMERDDRVSATYYYFELANSYKDDGLTGEGLLALKKVGNLMHGLRNFKAARVYYYQVLHTNHTVVSDTLRGHLNYNIGLAASENEDDSLAMVYLDTAISIYQKLGLQADLADAYIERGIVFWNRSQYANAVHNYELALKIAPKEGNRAARAYNNIGNAYLKQRRFAEAKTFFERSLSIELMAESLNNIGEVYLVDGNRDSALYCFKRTLSIVDIKKDDAEALGEYKRALLLLSEQYKDTDLRSYRQYMELWKAHIVDEQDLLRKTEELASYMAGQAAIARINQSKEERLKLKAEQRLRFWSIFVVVVLFLGYILYQSYRRNQKGKLDFLLEHSKL